MSEIEIPPEQQQALCESLEKVAEALRKFCDAIVEAVEAVRSASENLPLAWQGSF